MDRRVSPDVQELGIRYTPNPRFLMGHMMINRWFFQRPGISSGKKYGKFFSNVNQEPSENTTRDFDGKDSQLYLVNYSQWLMLTYNEHV